MSEVNDIHIIMVEILEDGRARVQQQSIFAGRMPKGATRPPPQVMRPSTGEEFVSHEVAARQVEEVATAVASMVQSRPEAHLAAALLGATRRGKA